MEVQEKQERDYKVMKIPKQLHADLMVIASWKQVSLEQLMRDILTPVAHGYLREMLAEIDKRHPKADERKK